MNKHYILIILFAFVLLFSQQCMGQSITQNKTPLGIEDLSIYPNPVNQGRLNISITTRLNDIKEIEIFNVLGKRIYSETLFGKELNIAKLNAGVYILKVTENNISATRKLVIK